VYEEKFYRVDQTTCVGHKFFEGMLMRDLFAVANLLVKTQLFYVQRCNCEVVSWRHWPKICRNSNRIAGVTNTLFDKNLLLHNVLGQFAFLTTVARQLPFAFGIVSHCLIATCHIMNEYFIEKLGKKYKKSFEIN